MTKQKQIRELHELLVQTSINYINKHGLFDIYGVQFQASDLSTSAKAGKWTAETDSSLIAEGLKEEGGILVRFEIGTSM